VDVIIGGQSLSDYYILHMNVVMKLSLSKQK